MTNWNQHADETDRFGRTIGLSSLDMGSEDFTARGIRASQSLANCRSAVEVEGVLAVLEGTAREQWETALRDNQRPAADAVSSCSSDRGGGSSVSSSSWEMAHPVPKSLRRPRALDERSARFSEKALTAAAQLEAIALSLRGAGVRADLAQACEDVKSSTLACLTPQALK